MASFNRVILAGNLTRDPEFEAFGRQAEVIAQYMRKGRPLLVEGRLKQDTWEDKTTHQKKSKLKVVLEGFSFIDSKGSDGGGSSSPDAPRRPAAAPASSDSTRRCSLCCLTIVQLRSKAG